MAFAIAAEQRVTLCVLGESVELLLRDRPCDRGHNPLYSLGAGWVRQRTLVLIERAEVEPTQDALEVDVVDLCVKFRPT